MTDYSAAGFIPHGADAKYQLPTAGASVVWPVPLLPFEFGHAHAHAHAHALGIAYLLFLEPSNAELGVLGLVFS